MLLSSCFIFLASIWLGNCAENASKNVTLITPKTTVKVTEKPILSKEPRANVPKLTKDLEELHESKSAKKPEKLSEPRPDEQTKSPNEPKKLHESEKTKKETKSKDIVINKPQGSHAVTKKPEELTTKMDIEPKRSNGQKKKEDTHAPIGNQKLREPKETMELKDHNEAKDIHKTKDQEELHNLRKPRWPQEAKSHNEPMKDPKRHVDNKTPIEMHEAVEPKWPKEVKVHNEPKRSQEPNRHTENKPPETLKESLEPKWHNVPKLPQRPINKTPKGRHESVEPKWPKEAKAHNDQKRSQEPKRHIENNAPKEWHESLEPMRHYEPRWPHRHLSDKSHEFIEPKWPKEAKEHNEPKRSQGPKRHKDNNTPEEIHKPGEPKWPKEAETHNEPKRSQESRQHLENKTPKPKWPKEASGPNQPKWPKEARGSKDLRNSEDFKESRKSNSGLTLPKQHRSIINELPLALRLTLLKNYKAEPVTESMDIMREAGGRRVGIEGLVMRRQDAEAIEADDQNMKMKLFRLMYESVRDSDLKVKRAELIKKSYANSTTFEIGFLLGDITDKYNIMTDIGLTLKRLYHEWKPIEHINAYEQIANLGIDVGHLVDMIKSVEKKLSSDNDNSENTRKIEEFTTTPSYFQINK